jgi:hypothetical protein
MTTYIKLKIASDWRRGSAQMTGSYFNILPFNPSSTHSLSKLSSNSLCQIIMDLLEVRLNVAARLYNHELVIFTHVCTLYTVGIPSTYCDHWSCFRLYLCHLQVAPLYHLFATQNSIQVMQPSRSVKYFNIFEWSRRGSLSSTPQTEPSIDSIDPD